MKVLLCLGLLAAQAQGVNVALSSPPSSRHVPGARAKSALSNSIDSLTTQCAPGARNPNCTTLCTLDCNGHGVCATSSPYAPQTCVCDPGWAGPTCAEASVQIHSFVSCRDWCYHGSCQKGVCVCEPGFSGPRCSVQLDPSAGCSPACQANLGTCYFGKCFCPPGASGNDCELTVSTNESAAQFLSSTQAATTAAPTTVFETTTTSEYAGSARDSTTGVDTTFDSPTSAALLVTSDALTTSSVGGETRPCGLRGNVCSVDHGTCRWGRCYCQAGWAGSSCLERAPACAGGGDCSRHGVCISGICLCRPGFESGDGGCERVTLGAKIRHALFKGQQAFSNDAEATSVLAPPVINPKTAELMQDPQSVPEVVADDPWLLNSLFCSAAPPQSTIDLFTGRSTTSRAAARKIHAQQLCSGHGLCVFAQCLCEPGWQGALCEKQQERAIPNKGGLQPSLAGRYGVLCPNDCSGHGTCNTRDGTCTCLPTHRGASCSLAATCRPPAVALNNATRDVAVVALANELSQDCSGHGTCSSQDRCVCFPGYSGKFCEKAQPCVGDCSGRGLCLDAPGNGSAASAGSRVVLSRTCACPPGFGGDSCEFVLGVEDTGNIDDSSSSANAPAAISQDRVCPNACSGHGKCMLLQDNGLEVGRSPLENSSVASRRGRAASVETWRCQCEIRRNGTTWTGLDCSKRLDCPSGCSPDRGTCFFGKCICHPGFSGATCNIADLCLPEAVVGLKPSERSSCSGHGTCAHGKCHCEVGFNGAFCESQGFGSGLFASSKAAVALMANDLKTRSVGSAVPCPGDGACSGNGICLPSGRCACVPQYSGEKCSVPRDGAPEHILNATNASSTNSTALAPSRGSFVPQKSNSSLHARQIELVEVPVTTTDGCPNGCGSLFGYGECVNNRCFCRRNRGGQDCMKATPTPCDSDCSSHGICFFGECVCDSPWGGTDCATNMNDLAAAAAEASGLFSVRQVSGSPRQPRSAQLAAVPSFAWCLVPCNLDHGACLAGQPHMCSCFAGFTGPACETRVSPNPFAAGSSAFASPLHDCWSPASKGSKMGPCSGHGVCTPLEGRGQCSCSQGYSGRYCSTKIVIGNSCNGYGVFDTTAGICECLPGFLGPTCAQVRTTIPRKS